MNRQTDFDRELREYEKELKSNNIVLEKNKKEFIDYLVNSDIKIFFDPEKNKKKGVKSFLEKFLNLF